MINISTFEKWASAPSPTEQGKSKHTHEMIRTRLEAYLKNPAFLSKYNINVDLMCEHYLQGSYGNNTNINWESDVDIVFICNASFYYNVQELPEDSQQKFLQSHPPAPVQFEDYKRAIYAALSEIFGEEEVERSKKTIKVKANTSRIHADVVPCFQFRKYKHFHSLEAQSYNLGVQIFNTETGEGIINYPKPHMEHCESKNNATNGIFKKMIRLFKNLKVVLIQEGKIDKELISSYDIENLLYNCTDHCFTTDLKQNFIDILNFIYDAIEGNRISGRGLANEQETILTTLSYENVKEFTIQAYTFFTTNWKD